MTSPIEQQQWIEAIHDDRLAEIDHPVPHTACSKIGRRMADEIAAIQRWLVDAGISADLAEPVGEPRQLHAAELTVADGTVAASAAAVLSQHGFEVWEPTTRAAGEIQRRFRSVLTLARTTDVTVAVRFRWPAQKRRLPGGLIPNQADTALVDLPATAWPLLFMVRPARLLAERIGLRRPAPAVLGPFLATPLDLVPDLLDVAEVSENDTVADLGCGDGRLLVEAVTRTGCRAIGIETDPTLVQRALERSRSAGVAGRVRIVHGDASSSVAELSQATTVFVFLPADTASDLVRDLLSSLTAGTKIIAHEQHRLPHPPPGADRRALIAGEGVTVAHQWVVGRSRSSPATGSPDSSTPPDRP